MQFTFEEIGLIFTGSEAVFGRFDGRFSVDDDGLVEWIELDGHRSVGRSWEVETITLPADDPIYDRLADALLKEFADEIIERQAADRPYVDRYADYRFDKQHYGIR